MTTTQIDQVVDLWAAKLDAVESQDFAKVDTEIDWVIKRKLFQRYQDNYGWSCPTPRSPSSTSPITTSNAAAACSTCCSARAWRRGSPRTRRSRRPSSPPQTTQAKLRGDFIAAAQNAGRDFTVDWVHLKLNDQAQRTVLCKDPFRSVDERVERLIASM